VICDLGLCHSDPVPQGWCTYEFPSAGAMMRFVLEFGLNCDVEGNEVTVRDDDVLAADAVVGGMGMTQVVTALPLFAVWIRGQEDEQASIKLSHSGSSEGLIQCGEQGPCLSGLTSRKSKKVRR
jgi:hypothetical protein